MYNPSPTQKQNRIIDIIFKTNIQVVENSWALREKPLKVKGEATNLLYFKTSRMKKNNDLAQHVSSLKCFFWKLLSSKNLDLSCKKKRPTFCSYKRGFSINIQCLYDCLLVWRIITTSLKYFFSFRTGLSKQLKD